MARGPPRPLPRREEEGPRPRLQSARDALFLQWNAPGRIWRLASAVCGSTMDSRAVGVEPTLSAESQHVYSCFDALLANLNGHAQPAVPYEDAVW